MRHAFIVAAFLVLASYASALESHTIKGATWRDLTPAETLLAEKRQSQPGKHRELPPARFDYFNPDVIVARVPLNEIRVNCHALGAVKAPNSCAYRTGLTPRYKKCLIVLSDDNSDPYLTINFRHEMGHCNGWPGTHPD